jgi:hypothetical protein
MALSLRQSARQQPMQIADKMRIPLWDDHAVRDALQDANGPLFIATPAATHLDDVATYWGRKNSIWPFNFGLSATPKTFETASIAATSKNSRKLACGRAIFGDENRFGGT